MAEPDMKKNKPRILECTLRDGSYVIDFQFTRQDTINIVSALEDVGFDMIEIGHGVGLGASEKGGDFAAAETDETYMAAAAETVRKADWGMFCIPGIANLSHLDMAADYKMKFIRLGANVEDYKNLEPFIKRAKKHGFFVCANLMKSYVAPPAEFAKVAHEIEKFGADLIYIVDSSGGMLPNELMQYIQAVQDRSATIRLGFHGHHNLGLGVANALVAIEQGVEIVDSTLQGFGRSAGNTPTEQLLSALLRSGIDSGIDPIAAMDIGEKIILPMIEKKGLSSLDIVSGMSLFHSSYMPVIKKYATQYRVDPRRLIVEVCRHDKSDAPEKLVEEQAIVLSGKKAQGNWKPQYKHYIGGEQRISTALSNLYSHLTADNAAEKEAVLIQGKSYSYANLADNAKALISFFHEKGLKEGDKFVVSLENGIDFINCYLAALLGGFVIVPINSKLPAKDIEYIHAVTSPKLVIQSTSDLDYSHKNPDFKPRLDDRADFTIFFTSGTTSQPKGVCHSAGALLENAHAFNRFTGIENDVRMLHVMPMGYMAGFLNTVLCPLVAGGTVIVSAQFNAQSATDFWRDAITGSANTFWLSPSMASLVTRMTRDQASIDWVKANAKYIFVGTAPLPASVKAAFESKFGVPCLESYGMTEVLLVAVNLPDQSTKSLSAGKILAEVDIREEENGDLFIRSPFSLTRYIGSAEQEAIEFTAESWFPTGDIGHVDDDDYLYITGRKKDLIIHGGMNVSPRAVEEVIYQFPTVQDVAVVGKPHAFWGEEVAAFIVLLKGESFDQKSFSAYCEKALSPDSIPTIIKIVEELPRSSSGKIQKHVLKDML